MAGEVHLSRRAQKDLDRLPDPSVQRILDALENLGSEGQPPDMKPLVGRRPWRRLRVGSHRVILKKLDQGFLVARVIDRKDLERAIRTLPD